MTGPFEEEEFFEDEWVDVYDVEGKKTSLRHLATVRLGGKNYMILGEMQEELQDKGRLMLVREDQTVDGVTEYVVVHDEAEIERVMGHFAMHLLMDHLDELPDELAQELAQMDLADMEDIEAPCGCSHRPGEFCFCGIETYLQ
ncbi:MAG: DUF1292 domain-containing protein [Clostridia bacterium]|nr:DUF1292 domain-containing protein [Clostridia bacterium]